MEAFLLHFTAPLHIGAGGDDPDRTELVYHSDALKSAIFAVGLRLFPEWEDEPEKKFFGAFRISSCFPFAGGEFFLPKPLKFGFLETANQAGAAKKAKKIAFISARLFSGWVRSSAQKPFPADSAHFTPDGRFLCHTAQNALRNVYTVAVQQRVKVPLPGEVAETKPFYLERLYFSEGCGLYFLADFGGNETLRRQVIAALRLLGEEGIGTDRTVGNGRFAFDETAHIVPFSAPEQAGLGYYMSLGLYLPASHGETDKILHDDSAWGIIRRGGYIGAGSDPRYGRFRKNTVYFFTPGSVFRAEEAPAGTCADLRPGHAGIPVGHPIWRDGQCLFLKI